MITITGRGDKEALPLHSVIASSTPPLPAARRPAWPTGHIGWSFRGANRFQAVSTSFLAEGLRRGERLVFVADDPRPASWPEGLLRDGRLRIASTLEVYGAGVVDAREQRATFAGLLADALQAGFTGLRVAADNTSLVSSPGHLDAWRRWESLADEFIAANPVTGLCGFDLERVDAGALGVLMEMHPTTVVA